MDTLDDHSWSRLESAAQQAATRAYVPYSKFHVGAAVLTASGAVYTGCNVENASYPVTLCAERNAIAAAVAAEGPRLRPLAIMVVSPDSGNCSPCGACRQVLMEFGAGIAVRFADHGEFRTVTSADLLPWGFTAADLT